MLELLLYALLGALMGVVGGLFGIGGGLVAIPILGVVFGLDQQVAQGTALVMVVPNVLLALWRYHQRHHLNWRHVLLLSGSGFICAWLSALYAVGLDAELMRWLFVGFLLCMALYNLCLLLVKSKVQGSQQLRCSWLWLGPLGAVSGAAGGLFAVGSAVVATPLLTSVFGTTQVLAQGLSLSLAAPSTMVTLAAYAWHEQINWAMGIPMAVGGLLSIGLGVRLAHSLPDRLLRALFCGFLVVCAALLALR